MSQANRTNEPRRAGEREEPPSRSRRAMEAEEELGRAALEPELPVYDEESVATDPDAEEILNDTQTLVEDVPAGGSIVGPPAADRRRGVILSGGDVDAASDQPDGGDETVGGTNPTPDQDMVDELGRAAGVTYAPEEPLRPEEKEAQRDDERWELDPASSEDYPERLRAPDPPVRRKRPRRPS